jgi:prolyl 4-hydroxylase
VNAVTETKCIFDTVGTGELPAGCTLETLSREPRVYVVRDFLSDEECDQIIALAGDDMEQSITVDMETGKAVTVQHRTSTSKWLKRGDHPIVSTVEDRIAKLISLPAGHGADFNLLHYRIGQAYGAHDDFFDPDLPGLQKTLAQAGQRFLSILLYLADVESGGETIFPKVNFAFKPQKRAALLFYNVLPDGNIDRLSHHGSAPVVKGEKWVATKWIMERNLDDR